MRIKKLRPSKNSKSSKFPLGRAVVGLHACKEVIKVRPHSVSEVWLRSDWERRQDLQELATWAESQGCRIQTRSVEALDGLTSGHQGVCFWVKERPEVDWGKLKSEVAQTVVILDQVEDPHNLGAILRTAWLLGVQALFVPEVRSADLTPSVAKVASGGAEHVPVEAVGRLDNLIKELKTCGFWIFGLSGQADRDLWGFSFPEKTAWVVGSEGRGMRSSTAKVCDELEIGRAHV